MDNVANTYASRDVRHYAYFFTRQDLSPEQQIVQTAHAALKMGFRGALHRTTMSGEPVARDQLMNEINPDETYFTVIGVRNLRALDGVEEILKAFGFRYEKFIEPDIGDEATSIAVYPVHEDDRGPLHAFNWLKVSKL